MPWQRRGLGLAAAVALAIAFLWVAAASAAPDAAPPTPHEVETRAECLMCHGPGGMIPVPADHEGRANTSCLTCHPPVEAQPAAPPPAAEQPPLRDGGCLDCHSNPDLVFTFPNGEEVSAYVDIAHYSTSVHAEKGVTCIDCHVSITGYPHPERTAESYREYTLQMYNLCQKCHLDNYQEAQDSVHMQQIQQGSDVAPVCTDCHGAHDVVRATEPRTKGSEICGTCHPAVYKEYAESVHGHALLADSNPDVPVCTDCHGVHQIDDPRTAQFRVESPDLCASCHADDERMAKYGLSSRVVTSYKQEFHGVTVEQYKTRWPTIWCFKAVCTDCHGVHGIFETSDPQSKVSPANLAVTCGQCHEGADENFTKAWIGHYEPSPDNAPLVYYVNLFYQLVIPTIMVGLVGYIGLDVAHRVRNRKGTREE